MSTDRYEKTGVRLVGSRERDYEPNQSVTLDLLRCRECDALVENDWGSGANEIHTAWHAKVARLLAVLSPEENR